jgi:hypothetical protein
MAKPQSNPLSFKTELLSRGPGGAWTYLEVPFSVPEVFGRKGQVPVRATINGFTFRNSLIPRAGVHILGLSKDVLEGAGVAPGDTVKIDLAFDDAPRTVEAPADLLAALAPVPEQAKAFEALSYSHKKEYVDWITGAKKPETRAGRIEKAVSMLAERKTPRG